MNCAEAREELQLELDGALGVAEERALSGHLSACAECRRLRADLAEVAGWAAAGPELPAADGASLAGPVLAAIRRERRGVGFRRTAAAVSVAAAVVAWALVLPGLTGAPARQLPVPHPPTVLAPAPPAEGAAAASETLLAEWKAFALTGANPGEAEVRLARAELERRTAERLFRPEPAGEKPEKAAERRREVREAAAVAAAELGAQGVELLEEAARDPKRAREVLAGVSGQARPELVPVYVAAMRHRSCRAAAAALAEEATGLELGSSPADWRLWWEHRTARTRSLSPVEAAIGRREERPPPAPPPESELEGAGMPPVA